MATSSSGEKGKSDSLDSLLIFVASSDNPGAEDVREENREEEDPGEKSDFPSSLETEAPPPPPPPRPKPVPFLGARTNSRTTVTARDIERRRLPSWEALCTLDDPREMEKKEDNFSQACFVLAIVKSMYVIRSSTVMLCYVMLCEYVSGLQLPWTTFKASGVVAQKR